MVRTVVGIPTLGESELLGPLVDELVRQGGFDDLLIMDDRNRAGLGSFYSTWNRSWRYAAHKISEFDSTPIVCDPANLVLLNDDIVIPKRFVERLCDALRSREDAWLTYPDYTLAIEQDGNVPFRLTPTLGTYRQGGRWGAAFALRAELLNDPLPSIDETYKIWAGDDMLVEEIRLHGGKTYRVEGLALEHAASTTFSKHPELQAPGWEDLERFQKKYHS